MNYELIETYGRKLVKAWTRGVQFEDAAREQVLNVASLPFIHKWIAVMPDVHWGMGSTIGSVIPTLGAVIPAAVGVDIGCGMMAVRTTLRADQLPDNLSGMRSAIEQAVPHGRVMESGKRDPGSWGDELPGRVADEWNYRFVEGFNHLCEKHPRLARSNNLAHLGTLGTGNHFIEVCLDENDWVWFMLHSGSRGIGNQIGRHFIALAKKDMERWFVHLPDKDLSYFPEGSEHFDDYIEAVNWAQSFAKANRVLMMAAVVEAVSSIGLPNFTPTGLAVNCHHNYVARENHYGKNVLVTRKGAVRAREGDLGIIPGSMGARSYIVRGKGNRESFHSCSHGAGRAMSRKEAKRRFTIEDHEKATEGVECRKDEGVIDETPAAYKSIDAVMAAQSDLVDIVHTLRQVVCVKG